MSSQLQYRKTERQTSLHRRSGALFAADIVQLQHLNMLLSDTRALVNKVAGSGGHGLLEYGRVLCPTMTFTKTDDFSLKTDARAARFTIIVYGCGRRSVCRNTRQPNLTGMLLST